MLMQTEQPDNATEATSLTDDDERALDALRAAQRLPMTPDLTSPIGALSSLAVEELRSYNRSWNHPLGFVLKS